MVERLVRNEEVRGSIPLGSTRNLLCFQGLSGIAALVGERAAGPRHQIDIRATNFKCRPVAIIAQMNKGGRPVGLSTLFVAPPGGLSMRLKRLARRQPPGGRGRFAVDGTRTHVTLLPPTGTAQFLKTSEDTQRVPTPTSDGCYDPNHPGHCKVIHHPTGHLPMGILLNLYAAHASVWRWDDGQVRPSDARSDGHARDLGRSQAHRDLPTTRSYGSSPSRDRHSSWLRGYAGRGEPTEPADHWR